MSENFYEQWAKLPAYLGNHIELTVYALTLSMIISLPIGVWAAKWRPARWPTLAAASVIQTIPGLALLALMVLMLGAFGFWPAFTALVLYSVLPILRNTVTGITEVDPAMTEAGRGIGMTSAQILFRVELPLAAPVIIAGIRTATVWIVGIATLSTPVGQTSLGNYIFSGLQTRNWTAVLFGCVGAAVLAIGLDLLIALLESSARRRSRRRAVFAALGLATVLGGGLAAPLVAARSADPVSARGSVKRAQPSVVSQRQVRVGSKPFTEQYILSELITDRLESVGLTVKKAESLGSTIAFDALRHNELDVYVDYTGTIWANYMKRDGTAAAWRVLAVVNGWLADKHGIRCLGPLGFENAYCLAMRKDRANRLGIGSVDDLAPRAPSLKIGSDYEFFDRPEWFTLRDTYGLNFAELVSLDPSLLYEAVAGDQVDVITAYSSDGRIAAFDLEVLDDRKHAFPPYDAVLLLSPRASQEQAIVQALKPLIGAIDIQAMRRANQWVDADGLTPSRAAARLAATLQTPDPKATEPPGH